MKMFILASKSERRQQLLNMLGADFEVCVTDTDETVEEGLSPGEIVTEIACRKAKAAFDSLGSRRIGSKIIIAADTIVWLPRPGRTGELLGKPRDAEDAKRILHSLSGKVHEVYSGVALIGRGRSTAFYERTEVSFRTLDEREISAYAESGVLDKAGAYGIQDRGSLFVQRIDGDFYNVVGLPIARLDSELRAGWGFGLLG